MTPKSVFLKAMCAALLINAAPPVRGETFAVKLGKITLGQLTYSRNSKGQTLQSTLANTPLGVFNGTFMGTSRPGKSADHSRVTEFVGISKSSRKSRKVEVQIGVIRALSTIVTPTSEETPLSDPARVPTGVVDPVTAIGQLLTAKGCPKIISIYDGRRAIALLPTGVETGETTLICNITYQVIAGPGHLSPLKITTAKMRVTYRLQDTTQALTQIRLGSGIFNLVLDHVD